jgi:hypothetical protein
MNGMHQTMHCNGYGISLLFCNHEWMTGATSLQNNKKPATVFSENNADAK